jgi:hypothetical protein
MAVDPAPRDSKTTCEFRRGEKSFLSLALQQTHKLLCDLFADCLDGRIIKRNHSW